MRIYLYEQVVSTNDILKEKALAGEPEGGVVLAESQTSGRGRYGRSWISRPGKGLYFSLLLRPATADIQPGLISLLTSLAIVHALKAEQGVSAQVKWPNDVMVERAKIAGVLVETLYQDHRLAHAIVGIGLNLFDAGEELNGRFFRATSLDRHTRKKIDPDRLLQRILKEIMKEYRLLYDPGRRQRLCKRWGRHCLHLNRLVKVIGPDESISGVFRDVDIAGSALIEQNTGEIAVVHAGEFSLQEEICF
ncbi:biotin--[acetyl-CoA-carboxylase] ligase [bacterium]|nr:biotin--[acetyl-CoA-carboxylase] ligase [bacterium]